eukprot:996470_1
MISRVLSKQYGVVLVWFLVVHVALIAGSDIKAQGTSSQQQTGTPHQNDQSGTVIGDTTFYGGAAYNTYGTVGYGSSYGTGYGALGYGARYGVLWRFGRRWLFLGGGGYGGGFGATPYVAPQGTSSQQQTGTPHQNDQSGTVIGDTTFYGGAAYNTYGTVGYGSSYGTGYGAHYGGLGGGGYCYGGLGGGGYGGGFGATPYGARRQPMLRYYQPPTEPEETLIEFEDQQIINTLASGYSRQFLAGDNTNLIDTVMGPTVGAYIKESYATNCNKQFLLKWLKWMSKKDMPLAIYNSPATLTGDDDSLRLRCPLGFHIVTQAKTKQLVEVKRRNNSFTCYPVHEDDGRDGIWHFALNPRTPVSEYSWVGCVEIDIFTEDEFTTPEFIHDGPNGGSRIVVNISDPSTFRVHPGTELYAGLMLKVNNSVVPLVKDTIEYPHPFVFDIGKVNDWNNTEFTLSIVATRTSIVDWEYDQYISWRLHGSSPDRTFKRM